MENKTMQTPQAVQTCADNSLRYVNKKETVSFILYDIAGSISPGDFERFNTDVLKLNAGWFTKMNLIVGIWDIINDTFTGVLVDKTRTRLGKFRPYLIAFAVPAATIGLLRWLCCYFLPLGIEADKSLTKFFFILIINLISEGIETFKGVANTGLLASMTPNPEERVWLTARSKQLSSVVDNIPGFFFDALYDLVKKKRIKMDFREYYSVIAVGVTLLSVALSLYFFLTARERVVQSEQRPHIADGFRTLLRNKPMRLILISEFINAFSISVGKKDYFIDVLGMKIFGTLTELPSSPLSIVSYGWINRMRKRFSNKFLWILSSHMDSGVNIIIFLFGIIGGTGATGWYNKKAHMFACLLVLEFVRKTFWGVRQVIPTEITYESIDYCEWNDPDGIRNEGVILTAKGLITKLVNNTTGSLKAWIKSLFGYNYYTRDGEQEQPVKYSLFLLAYLIPALMGLMSVIPKLFYSITPEVRSKMYAELQQRREEKVLKRCERREEETGGAEE